MCVSANNKKMCLFFGVFFFFTSSRIYNTVYPYTPKLNIKGRYVGTVRRFKLNPGHYLFRFFVFLQIILLLISSVFLFPKTISSLVPSCLFFLPSKENLYVYLSPLTSSLLSTSFHPSSCSVSLFLLHGQCIPACIGAPFGSGSGVV